MAEQKNIPELRFPEFEGEWLTKRFEEIVKINQGLQIAISERYTEQEEGTLFYITNEFIKTGSDKKYFIKNPKKSVVCSKNDILMTRTGNTGIVVTDVEGAFHNNFFKVAYPKYISKGFLYEFLTLSRTQNIISKLAGTSTIPDLNHSDFYRIEITYPSLPEQQKIASFFTAIDQKISQRKQKKTLLEQYKKGVMQKIFSQQIRFKDDNEQEFPKWERKRLGEIGDFQTSSIDKLYIEGEKEVRLVNYMNVYRHETIKKETIDKLQLVTAKKNQIDSNSLIRGDILFTPSSETPSDIGHSAVIFEDLDDCVYSYHLIRFRPKIEMNILFSHYFCNISDVLKQLSRLATGSTRFTISVKAFSSIETKIPCLQEQTKIANFLSAIDAKINYTQTQIKNAELWKKGLLQKMFV